jgi:integrase
VEVVTGGVALDYIRYLRRLADGGKRSHETVDAYEIALAQLLDCFRRTYPRQRRFTVGDLTQDNLLVFDEYLVRVRKLGVSARKFRMSAAVMMWRWAFDSDAYGQQTPRPRTIEMPETPVPPVRAPRWAQMDLVVSLLRLPWHRQLSTLVRFTGLRIDQAFALEWEDFDLEACEVTIRPELGKSKAERRGRRMPISGHLAREMAGWGPRTGRLFCHAKPPYYSINRAWRESGVPPVVWRRHVNHAFRKGFESELLAAGVRQQEIDFLVGHAAGLNADHYIDPTWALRLRDAVDQIPPMAVGVVPMTRREAR